MVIEILFLVAGFGLLIVGGNWLLKASVDMAAKMGLSKIIIGLTVVSFATSAPELIVSINAAINGSTGISLGNVIGSNIANIGMVLGLTVLISPISIPKNFLKTDWLFLIIVSIILIGFLFWNKDLSRLEGFIFLGILGLYIFYLLKRKEEVMDEVDILVEDINENEKWHIIIFYLIIGGLGLWLGADLLVRGAEAIATQFGVKESVIGLTVVAIGTSIPELAASIIAALKGEKAISFGNLIGSNIFNILSVLGITAIIQPIVIEDSRFLESDIFWMIGFSIVILPLSFIYKRNIIGWPQGLILLGAYIFYIYSAF